MKRKTPKSLLWSIKPENTLCFEKEAKQGQIIYMVTSSHLLPSPTLVNFRSCLTDWNDDLMNFDSHWYEYRLTGRLVSNHASRLHSHKKCRNNCKCNSDYSNCNKLLAYLGVTVSDVLSQSDLIIWPLLSLGLKNTIIERGDVDLWHYWR